MTYQLEILRRARKVMDRLPDSVAQRIRKKVQQLTTNPFPSGCKKLVNTEGAYRIRVGDYRVLYGVKGNLITIANIGHRKNIYQ